MSRTRRDHDGASGSLAGRAVLVTGASGGIGRAAVAELLARGASVTLLARRAGPLADVAGEIAARTSPSTVARMLTYPADVAEPGAMEAAADATVDRFGRLDGLLHAAAVMGPIGPALEVDPAAWWDAVRVDLHGSFLAARAAAARMAPGGSIVLLSGGGATSPFPRYSAYAAAKAGVVRLAETLAVEWAERGIRVNALAPGFVATGIHDATLEAGALAGADYLERTRRDLAEGGVPPELPARAAAFLLGPASAPITGRLLAAPWDDWERWPERAKAIVDSDLFTLRRIVPRDRGEDWQ